MNNLKLAQLYIIKLLRQCSRTENTHSFILSFHILTTVSDSTTGFFQQTIIAPNFVVTYTMKIKFLLAAPLQKVEYTGFLDGLIQEYSRHLPDTEKVEVRVDLSTGKKGNEKPSMIIRYLQDIRSYTVKLNFSQLYINRSLTLPPASEVYSRLQTALQRVVQLSVT